MENNIENRKKIFLWEAFLCICVFEFINASIFLYKLLIRFEQIPNESLKKLFMF